MRIFLAPMEGVVDNELRKIYSKIGGIDLFVTEFVRVTHYILPAKVFKRRCPELLSPLTEPVRIQLLGSDPTFLARNALKAARLGAPAIDLNFGCPAKTVNKNKGGACLLDEPDLLFNIVSSVRKLVPKEVPVTAKIRLGYLSRHNYVDNALAIQEAGASEIIVHGRSKVDGYKPPAFWDCIGEIKDALDIPVIANGEIWSLDDLLKCKSESGCEDFMLGRGLLAKPDLAQEIKAYFCGTFHQKYTWIKTLNILHNFHSEQQKLYGEKYSGNRIKQWLVYLKLQYQQANTLFENIKREKSFEAIDRRLLAELNA